MATKNETVIKKDLTNKKLTTVRYFDAPGEIVWQAWTNSSLLDKWWAPKPYKAVTKTLDFREGGVWLYAMVGPDGSQQYCRVDYKTIIANESFSVRDSFCDENGKENPDFPHMTWKNDFYQDGPGTRVEVEITFESEEALKKIIEMGFEAGFTAALANLDELVKQKG